MPFISDSQDILFLVLAFCALWLTAFLVWFLYYAVMTFKQVYESVKQVRDKIQAVDEVITMIKEKITSSASYFSLIMIAIKKIIEVVGSNKEEKKVKNKK